MTDLNEAFKLQEFNNREQYPVLDFIDEKIDRHYDESFEKKFEELFQKRFSEEFNKRIELLVTKSESESRFSLFTYVMSSIREVFVSFLDVLKKNQQLNNLLHIGTGYLDRTSTKVQKSETVPNVQKPDGEVVTEVVATEVDVAVKPMPLKEANNRISELIKEEKYIGSFEEAQKKFNEFNAHRNELVDQVLKNEVEKRKHYYISESPNTGNTLDNSTQESEVSNVQQTDVSVQQTDVSVNEKAE